MSGTVGVIVNPVDDVIDDNGDNTKSLVSSRFDLSQDYADKSFNTALDYLGQFNDISVGFSWTPSEPVDVSLPTSLENLSVENPIAGTIRDINITPTEFTQENPIVADYDLTHWNIPEFNISTPDFFLPTAPDTKIPVYDIDDPLLKTINIPEATDIPDLPVLPVLKEILPPDEPTFELPAFTSVMPVMDLTPPDLLYSWNEAEYDSDLSTALKNKIIDGILNGGVGMLPEVEQAIYDRGRLRLDIENQEATLLVKNEFSSIGSRLPQGAMLARLDSARIKAQLARTDLNDGIIIKSSDLAYQYSTFIIEKGIALEHEFMNLFNSAQQRAFEASKLLIEFAIQEYDIRVKAFSARLEGYKTEAEIFKTRISAEIARAELYKTVIEGRRLSIEMQGLMVDLYGKQLSAIETMAKIYAIKMDGAKIESEINSQNVEQFKALIEAYTAQVGAVTAEYNLYQAQIVGESEKAKMYSYQVEGYKTVVDSFKLRSEIDIAEMNAGISKSQAEINVFTALLDKYKTEVSAKTTEAETQAKLEGLKIQAFEGDVKKFTASVAAIVDSYKAESSVSIANTDANLRYGEILAKIEEAQAELAATLIKAKAAVASQLASAALTSVSAGASLGYTQSASESSVTALGGRTNTNISAGGTSNESHTHTYAEKCCD